MKTIRINKFLADCGISSRRKSEELILQRRVTVNGKIIDKLDFKIDPEKDTVELDGEKIRQKKNLYFLLNKPKSVITSVSDDRNRKTVVDILNIKERVYPVGRLDYDSTGVILLTNDGEFSQLLTHPRNKVPREYEVKINRPVTVEDEEKLLKGIYLDGKKGKFLKIKFPKEKDKKIIIITCEEGRNRFVKRMFGTLDYEVISLNRISFAGIKADIQPGKSRRLNPAEVKLIKEKYSN